MQNGTKREIPLMRSPYPREIPEPAAGIHAIALNPSKSFMATGGHNVNDLALYSLPDYQPYAVGEFHHNWLFGISWINDFMLCTGKILFTFSEYVLVAWFLSHHKQIKVDSYC